MTSRLRLQKFLAERGYGSRRACEKLISAGRVRINETLAELGMSLDPASDRVFLDGELISSETPALRSVVLHKPRGYQCTAAKNVDRTVYDLLPSALAGLRIAGRLDKNSEGLLVLSNDGMFLQHLTHPRYECVKMYQVTVSGLVNSAVLNELRTPMKMRDGYLTRPADVSFIKSNLKAGRAVLRIRLSEGRNRQIRYLCERSRLKVHRLVRISYGNLTLEGLSAGKWRDLTPKEVVAMGCKV